MVNRWPSTEIDCTNMSRKLGVELLLSLKRESEYSFITVYKCLLITLRYTILYCNREAKKFDQKQFEKIATV